MLFNQQGRIFVGRRFNSWQMPQGGIENGEDPKQAALRELSEEIGTDKVEIIAESQEWLYYDLPKELVSSCWNGKYAGQKQKWLLMKFLGSDQDINVYTDYPEFEEWLWQDIDNLVNNVVSFKKEVYRVIVREFLPIIKLAIK